MKLFARMLISSVLVMPVFTSAGDLKGPPPETKQLIRLSSDTACTEVLKQGPDTSGWVVLVSGYMHNRNAIISMSEGERQQYADGLLALCQMFPEKTFLNLASHLL